MSIEDRDWYRDAQRELEGRVVDGVRVTVGPVSVTNVKVGVGLVMGDDKQALLGQSFLSKLDMSMNQKQMVLRPR